MTDAIEDEAGFVVSVSPTAVGARGCGGRRGECPWEAAYSVTFLSCAECTDTRRECRYLGHQMDHPDHARLCGVCLLYIRGWNLIASILTLQPDPGPPPQLVE